MDAVGERTQKYMQDFVFAYTCHMPLILMRLFATFGTWLWLLT